MTKTDIRQDYFQWLVDKVHGENHLLLMKDLHERPFIAIVDNDNNRAYDGIELREDYIAEELDEEDAWKMDMSAECSVLEMLIALAKEMDFQLAYDDEDRTDIHFWEMMENLNLTRFTDEEYVSEGGVYMVDAILTDFLTRDYEPDGRGGIFPLRNPTKDQRGVELWYQMQAYLGENYPM